VGAATDLLPYSALHFIFYVFRPEIACPVPKLSNYRKQKEMSLHVRSPQSAILREKAGKAHGIAEGFRI
jgi:hypothetical protein